MARSLLCFARGIASRLHKQPHLHCASGSLLAIQLHGPHPLRPASQRDLNGRNYYELEFLAKTSRYTRHQVAVVACANGGCGCAGSTAGAGARAAYL